MQAEDIDHGDNFEICYYTDYTRTDRDRYHSFNGWRSRIQTHMLNNYIPHPI